MELKEVDLPLDPSTRNQPSGIRVASEDAEWVLSDGRKKLLDKAATVLLHALEPGEKVRLVAQASIYRGWAFFVVTWRRPHDDITLVVTDRRFLLIRVDEQSRPRLYANQIRFDRVRRLRNKGLGLRLGVETGGEVVQIGKLSKAARARIESIVETQPGAVGGSEPLCPACLRPQTSTSEPCTHCGNECKTSKTAVMRSWLLPGLGELYLGERFIGVIAVLTMAAVWFAFIGMLVLVLALKSDELGPSDFHWVWIVGAILLVVHGVSARATASRASWGRYSSDLVLPTGGRRVVDGSAPIVPDDPDQPGAAEALSTAAAKKGSSLTRYGRRAAAAVGGVLVFVPVVVAFGMLDALAAKKVALEDDDYRYLVTVDDLTEWVDWYEPDPDMATGTMTIYPDGSYDIEYEYDDPDALYIGTTLTVERGLSDAVTVYGGNKAATLAVYGTSDVELESADDFMDWGDQSTHAFLTSDGARYGQVFLAREGRTVLSVTLSGVYFDDPADYYAFLDPVLDEVTALAQESHRRPQR